MLIAGRRRYLWLLPAYSALVLALLALAWTAPVARPQLRADDASRARQALSELPSAAALFRAGRYDAAAVAFQRIAADLPRAEHAAAAAALLGLAGPHAYLRVLAGIHSNLGASQLRARRFDSAIASLQTAIAIDPTAFRPRSNLATVLKRQRRYAEAFASFEDAIARGGLERKLLLDFGAVCLRLGEHTRARWALNQARRPARNDVQAWGTALEADCLLAQLDEEEGRLREASEGLRAVLSRAPGYAEARYRLVRLLQRQGHTDEAEQHRLRFDADSKLLASIESALAAGAGRVDALQWVADSYRALGLLHFADVHYRQLLSRNPADTKALLALHDLRARIGAPPQPASVARQGSKR